MKERGVFERRLLFFLACIAGAVFSAVLFLSPLDVSAKLYQPGETLNPDCAPGTADCGIIRDSLVESKNKIITATTTKNEIWSQFENNSPSGIWGG